MLTGNLQIKNGKYYAVLNLKVNGKRKPKWIPLGLPERGNKREAESLLNHLIVEYETRGEGKFYPTLAENGELLTEPPKADESEVLFADYVQSWLKMICPTVSAATYNSYRSMVDARIDRYFRKLGVTLGALTPTQLQTFYQAILDDGNTTNTVIHYHAVLHRALKNAVKKDVIDRNPADRVDKPRKNRYQASHYTQAEMLRLFSVIEGDPLEPAIRIAAYYGLRRSEVLGLQWDSIDWENNRIHIDHKAYRDELKEGRPIVISDQMKTESSRRTLPLIPFVRDELLAHKEQLEYYRKMFRSGYNRKWLNCVCVGPTGNLIAPSELTGKFRAMLKRHGLRLIRFHDLRHSCASLLVASGIPIKMVQLYMGHSNYSTTADIYAHLNPEALDASGACMENLLAPKAAAEGKDAQNGAERGDIP